MCLLFSSFRSCSSIIWPKLISEDIKKCEMTLTHSIGLTFRVLMKEWQEQKISERHGEMEEYGWRWSRGGPRWQWLIIHFITSCSAPLLLLWGFFLLFHCSSWGGMLCAFVCLYFDDSLPSFSLFPASHYLFPSFPTFSPTPSLSLSRFSPPVSLSLALGDKQ